MQSNEDVVAQLRESASAFAARDYDPKRFRERMGVAPGYDVKRFRLMQALGWRGALVHKEHGGAGLGLREVAAIVRELGRGLAGDVLLSTSVLPVRLLQDGAALPAALPLLQAAASGSKVFALAWQEHPTDLDPMAVTMNATRRGAEFELIGRKAWVSGGQAAGDFLVSARLAGGIAVFHLPRDTAGLSVESSWQVDGSDCPRLGLDHVCLPAQAMVLPPDAGALALRRAIDAAAVAAGAELLGVAEAAFDMTIGYLKTRVQYDKLIGSFQALQHKAVDLLVQRELAASVLEEALAAFGDDSPLDDGQRSRLASRCKARCSDAALRITRECIQLSGAIGYTHEYDLGLYVKRALVLAAWLGNAAQHRKRHVLLDAEAAG